MAFLSYQTIRRLIQALASQPAGNEVLGSLGQYGGFQLNSNASIAKVTGDIAVIPDPGGEVGAYRVLLPNINAGIQSIDWAVVSGFTPRNPGATETAVAGVTGYAQDATTKQWYITVQISTLTTGAILSTPPQGFAVGVRCSVTYNPQWNRL